jgi:hypothetical protein
LALLESLNPLYQVNLTESGTPEACTASYLRVSRATWGDLNYSSGWIYSYGEEDWFANSTALARTKAGISYCNTHNLAISAMGFGWCWDDSYGTLSSAADPVYGARWSGVSTSGPEGSRAWGLDAGDYSSTGNSICMDTYLNATQGYIDFCAANSYPTKVFFTTGPVDTYYNSGEVGYQGSVKHQHIRNYVKNDPARILFDYADILCWDDNGVQTTVMWSGHTFPRITSTNGTPEQTGHISNAGAIRLAKAMWWMLARMAGWNGVPTEVEDVDYNNGKFWTEVSGDELKVHLPENMHSCNVALYSLDGGIKTSRLYEGDLLSINISGLPSGLYVLVIQHDSGTVSKKIILP